MRYTGVTARGIVTQIFHEGDDLVRGVVDSLLSASEKEGFPFFDGDIVAVTEAVVGRTQGNYASVEQIAKEVSAKVSPDELGIVFPILSRNRFAIVLKAIAMGTQKLVVQLSYPADEMGNAIVSLEQIDEKGVNPCSDSFTEQEFRDIFGNETFHRFTGIDYISYYKSLGANIEIVFSNDPCYILRYTNHVIAADIHSRFRTAAKLKAAGAHVVRLDQLMNQAVDGSGYHPTFGLLGANKANENRIKLFPVDTDRFVLDLQQALLAATGKHFECMVYGDGGFKDPVGGIWELADPVISPSFTKGLEGTPNELKIKYIADEEFGNLRGEELANAIKKRIREKELSPPGKMQAQGTTPRHISDLIGSLCDLVSGSGDRGTPVVLVQNYFTNYANES